jgi:hypothetical protein
VLEETGIDLSSSRPRFATVQNVLFPGGQHYVTIFMQATVAQVRASCRQRWRRAIAIGMGVGSEVTCSATAARWLSTLQQTDAHLFACCLI